MTLLCIETLFSKIKDQLKREQNASHKGECPNDSVDTFFGIWQLDLCFIPSFKLLHLLPLEFQSNIISKYLICFLFCFVLKNEGIPFIIGTLSRSYAFWEVRNSYILIWSRVLPVFYPLDFFLLKNMAIQDNNKKGCRAKR